jgi:hypothetical protein
MFDWLGGSVHLVLLVVMLLVPFGLTAHVLRTSWPIDGGLRFLLLAVPGMWLLFPVGLLSSLSATSRWVFFRPAILGRLLQLFPTTVGFYLLTAMLALAAAAIWYGALFTGHGWLLLPAALVGSAALLIYARLLGRMALLIHRLNPVESAAAKPARKKPRKKKRKRSPEPEPPSAPPPEAADSGEPRKKLTPYGTEAEDVGEYGLAEAPPPPDEPESQQELYEGLASGDEEDEEAPRQAERGPRRRREPVSAPAAPLLSGVFTFPWTGLTLRAWIWLSMGGLALGYGLRLFIDAFSNIQ